MGRPSKLSEAQWDEVKRRRLAGESFGKLAMEFGVSKQAIMKRIGDALVTVKAIANQMVSTEQALRKLPVTDQLLTASLADELRAISLHMAGAARWSSASSHKLSRMAHEQLDKVDDVDPLQSEQYLKGSHLLQKMANEAGAMPAALLKANEDAIREINSGASQSKDDLLREIASNLPN